MVNRSKNRFTMKTKYGAAVAPVFFLAGAYVAWNYINHRLWRKKDDNNGRDIRKGIHNSISKETSLARRRKDQKNLSRSVSMGAIRGGKVALQRLLDLHSYHLDTSSLVNAEIEFESLLSRERPDFGLLQRDIVKMEMSGKEAKGVEILKKALDKAKAEGKGHEAYEIEMLLVEMLIYMTIIYYFRGDPWKQVEEAFNRFREIQMGLQWPGNSEESESHEITLDEFKKVMESLKHEIEDSKKRQTVNSTPREAK
ncbi:hypothetical protein YC2023_064759 [Brassica napus]